VSPLADAREPLSWLGIARLGLVQAMIGAVVVLTTSTLNRVMALEWALPALVPGLLVALHYAVQLSRPRMGFGSDRSARRTPWIVGGMCVLASGGALAALATAWMGTDFWPALALATLAFVLVGLGVAASGTSLLALLATRVAPERRGSAAALVWVMMIAGFAITAGSAGRALEPFGPTRLVLVCASVSVIAVVVTVLALWDLEGRGRASTGAARDEPARTPFRQALTEVWAEPDARRFTIFVLVSMVAYSGQDLILEPFAGMMFGMTPGQTTQLAGVQHGGTLVGMLLAALAGRRIAGAALGSLRAWTVGGCLVSALALVGLVLAATGLWPEWPIRANVFAMGVANGAFSIAAIGSMMSLAGGAPGTGGRQGREGTRMGLWGAAQALGFATGGVLGAAASDLLRWLSGSPAIGYAGVFAIEAAMFGLAALLAWRGGGLAAARWPAGAVATPGDPSPVPVPPARPASESPLLEPQR